MKSMVEVTKKVAKVVAELDVAIAEAKNRTRTSAREVQMVMGQVLMECLGGLCGLSA